MKTKRYLSCLTLVLAVTAGLAACDKASPVAPEGTVLSVTANPTQITATGTSQIRVVALRANGTPVNPGTQIRLSSNLGTVDPVAVVGEDGIATATLQGDGRIGTATVTAAVGAETTATVEVAVGRAAANISLQASPAQVDEEGGTIELISVVRDATGEPLANAAVNFQTQVGTLASRGGVVRTDANALARDRLTVTAADVQALGNQNTFNALATVGVGGGGTQTDTAQIRVSRCRPVAEFTATPGPSLTVDIANLSTGEEPLQFSWNFNGAIRESGLEDDRNPSQITYVQAGQYTIQLQVQNACGEGSASQTVRVCENPPCS